MMSLASEGRQAREGVRMGLWGASQAIAFGAGGFIGTVLVDAARRLFGPSPGAYAFVFALEAIGFFAAHIIALGITFNRRPSELDVAVAEQGAA
jgi:BCD family chlorophyll transporter-like MFS transporter